MSASRNKDTIEIKTAAPKEGTKAREAKIIALKRTLASGKTQKSQSKSQSRSRRTFNKEFEVEKIIGKKVKKGKIFYLVKWKGYSKKESTWEPDEYLRNCPKKINLYESKLQETGENQEIECLEPKKDSKSETKPPKNRKKSEKNEEDKKNQIKTKIEEDIETTEKKPAKKPRSTPGPTRDSSQQKTRRSRAESNETKQRKPRRTSNTRNKLDQLDKIRRMQLVNKNDSVTPEKRKLSFENNLHHEEDLTGSNGMKKVKVNPRYENREDITMNEMAIEQRKPMWELEGNLILNDRQYMYQSHYNEDNLTNRFSRPQDSLVADSRIERPIAQNLEFSENGYYRTPYTTTNSFFNNERRIDSADSSYFYNAGEPVMNQDSNDFMRGPNRNNSRQKHKVYDLSIFDSVEETNEFEAPSDIPLTIQSFMRYGPGSNFQYGVPFMTAFQPNVLQEEQKEIINNPKPSAQEQGNLDKIIDSLEDNAPEPSESQATNKSPINKEVQEPVILENSKEQKILIETENCEESKEIQDTIQDSENNDNLQNDRSEENEDKPSVSSPRSFNESGVDSPITKNQESVRKNSNETQSNDERTNLEENPLTQQDAFMNDFLFNKNAELNMYRFIPPHRNPVFYDSITFPDARSNQILNSFDYEDRRQEIKVDGSFEEGDIPVKVLSAKPIMKESDLELLVVWKRRLNGIQPEKSKIMRLDLLAKGYWMLMIEYYERKMKLDSVSDFDARELPRHYVNI